MDNAPSSLQEAIRYFGDPDKCLKFIANLRWPNGPVCPRCNVDKNIAFMSARALWRCRACQKQFSVKVNTIFEDSPIGLDKWGAAIWLIGNCKNGVSSCEIARDIDVTQKTAWFMLMRIRRAMRTGNFSKLGGEVEVDESFIGGKARRQPVRDALLERIQARRDAIKSRKGILPESYPMIRADRANR